MTYSILNKRIFTAVSILLWMPVFITAILAFFQFDGLKPTISLAGFHDLSEWVRIQEILTIAIRALIVSIVSTTVAFFISYLLIRLTTEFFQSIFLIAITLPFLANESVRVFSWQYLLSENGLLNHFLSRITLHPVTFFNGTNKWNIYFVMVITTIPFGIFLCSAALKTISGTYWKVADDIGLSVTNKLFNIILPLSKFALIISTTVIFFIAFSLSSEVNFLGGDTKLSSRNLILSLLSASKFQAIFSLGFFIMFTLGIIMLITRGLRLKLNYLKK